MNSTLSGEVGQPVNELLFLFENGMDKRRALSIKSGREAKGHYPLWLPKTDGSERRAPFEPN